MFRCRNCQRNSIQRSWAKTIDLQTQFLIILRLVYYYGLALVIDQRLTAVIMKFIIKSYYYSPMKLLTKINSLFRFSNESKPKSILLSYQSSLTSFTFLNCNISTLPKSNDTIINTINAPFIANYLENLR